jgi:hypothetical protein
LAEDVEDGDKLTPCGLDGSLLGGARHKSKLFNPEFLRGKGLPVRPLAGVRRV